jgi:hypothetical protein
MPLPGPKGKEKQKDFISRCMGDHKMNGEYPDNAQRAAVCHSQWKRAKSAELLAHYLTCNKENCDCINE